MVWPIIREMAGFRSIDLTDAAAASQRMTALACLSQ
jgi:hypothetical protein